MGDPVPSEAHDDGCTIQASGWGCLALLLIVIVLIFIARSI